MSASLLKQGDEIKMVIGSGGSKRIRTAISQVITQVAGFNRDLQSAVNCPRLYWDGETLQVEPGFAPDVINELSKKINLNLWDQKDVYFGGVHTVRPGLDGAGDPRRGGSVIVV